MIYICCACGVAGSRILKRWEMRMSINYAYLSLANVIVVISIGCHWVACMWGLLARADLT